jgi:bifunctional non-homologous end joining protein LigD
MSMDVSRPDKVLYPGPDYTKADLAEYYDAVAEVMLPHLGARALMLHRFPDGIDETGFYQKQLPANAPEFLATVTVDSNNRSGQVRHLTINDRGRDTLGWLADQACVEVHRWLSRTDAVDNPDLLVLDLDPPTPRDLGALRRTARAVRDLFDKIGLSPFLMATGGNGYHVVAPLDRATGFDEVRELVRDLADVLAAREPDTLTTQQRKVKRGNRIFLDTNRNAYGQTAIAPYSPRARPGAPVATPIGFDELGRVEPNGYDLASVRRRLARKDDPWADVAAHAASATSAHEQLKKLLAADSPK